MPERPRLPKPEIYRDRGKLAQFVLDIALLDTRFEREECMGGLLTRREVENAYHSLILQARDILGEETEEGGGEG